MPVQVLISARLAAVVHKAPEGGYWAEVPALPGCATQGETMAELRKNLRAAIDLYLDESSPAPARKTNKMASRSKRATG